MLAAQAGEFLGALIVAMLRYSNGAILKMLVEAIIIAMKTQHVEGKVDKDLQQDLFNQVDEAFKKHTYPANNRSSIE